MRNQNPVGECIREFSAAIAIGFCMIALLYGGLIMKQNTPPTWAYVPDKTDIKEKSPIVATIARP